MKRIVILGAGESGAGAAVLAKKEGFDVFVSDMSAIKDKYKQMLDSHGIAWEEGRHTEEKVLRADEIIKSPGIPSDAPMVLKAVERGIHIISEIEFAGRYTRSKMICITGSNGKTTTTSLIYHIFRQAGYDAGLAGNIGHSLALQVAEDPHEYYIIELSSFQLDNMYDFRANIAILLNITPDHLDRYGNCMQNYVDAKMRIIRNQTGDDAFIYWNDDPIIRRELDKYDIKAVQCPFSELKERGSIGYIEEGQYKIEWPTPFNMEQESLSLTGRHNIYPLHARVRRRLLRAGPTRRDGAAQPLLRQLRPVQEHGRPRRAVQGHGKEAIAQGPPRAPGPQPGPPPRRANQP